MLNNELNGLISNIDKLVHEPARLKILIYLNFLSSAEFVFLLNKTKLTKGNLSSHLSKLENANFVDIKKDFVDKIPRTVISITPTGRETLRIYKKNISNLMNIINVK